MGNRVQGLAALSFLIAPPEKHADLLVRVAGYSAYFVDLSKGLQDSIIARTEQRLGGV